MGVGIPLTYSGDEAGVLNDHSPADDPEKDGDTRRVHHPRFGRALLKKHRDPATPEGRIFAGLLRLSQLRQTNFALTRSETEIIDTEKEHVSGHFRQHLKQSVLVLTNLAKSEQSIAATRLHQLGLRKMFTDIVAGHMITATQKLTMETCQFMVLVDGCQEQAP